MKRTGPMQQEKDRDHKRLKIRQSRSIHVQSDSLENGAIDVEKFLSARSFEIRAFQDAMKRSKDSSSQRAFQSLPRCLRRRAASHNVRRIPKALRQRALYEMSLQSSTTKAIEPSRLRFKRYVRRLQKRISAAGKSKQIVSAGTLQTKHTTEDSRIPSLPLVRLVKGQFAQRQLRKIWLPTHLWTSKRAHMVNKWGYAIPQRPTAKSYRPTHRAAFTEEAIAFDMSYEPIFAITAPLPVLIEKYKSIFGARWALYSSCSRICSGLIKNVETGRTICPCLTQWNKPSEAFVQRLPITEKNNVAQVVLRVHPAAFVECWDYLSGIAVKDSRIAMHDWRMQLGSIDVLGPRANQVLHDVLQTPIPSTESNVWTSIKKLSHNQLPIDCSLGFHVNASQTATSATSQNSLSQKPMLEYWDAKTLPSFQVFDVTEVNGIGARNPPAITPLMVARRREWNGLTIILPWTSIMYFWRKLMFRKGVRFGGLDNLHQIAFEKQIPFFPHDYPETEAGIKAQAVSREDAFSYWQRRPPAKRVNFLKLENGMKELGDPFACDWSVLDKNYPTLTPVRFHLVHVIITCSTRGSIHDLARVYKLPTKESLEEWKKHSLHYRNKLHEVEKFPASPEESNLVGYISTGNFNLRQGKPSGIGCVIDQFSGSSKRGYCLIRNCGTGVFRLAQWKRF
ncbi:RNase P and RNase MRP subunit [Schizosaccharomyces japonicus yFS275]|uniref:RNase P and RNase MRP subunit n=1 Tax=Schizosaccharomyces japonicus (strain yFS275 / FY16936) TaxID=402676 RepID=B6K777_SCHJY|nr:RNase P and RNase MRP subunit [Schizosaccharomyces japonicus yFS275]EEB09381.1 RNase P and RNase MRP subunit [Schizosaccharomyces japonicus yFS275]